MAENQHPVTTSPAASSPALSVIVISHNYGHFLPECVESILSQDFRDFELILVDNGSTDDTQMVAGRFLADPRVRLEVHGTAVTFATALQRTISTSVKGRYFLCIGADDYAEDSSAFSSQVNAFASDPSVAVCFTRHRKLGTGIDDMRRLHPTSTTYDGPHFLTQLLTRPNFSVSQSGAMVSMDAYRRSAGLQPHFRHYQDLGLWVTLATVGRIAYVDDCSYVYRLHNWQFSGRGGRERVTVVEDCLTTLNWALETAAANGIPLARRKVLRARLGDPGLADAFANRRRGALRKSWGVLRAEPAAAATSLAWHVGVARALLGTRCWALLGRAARGVGYRPRRSS